MGKVSGGRSCPTFISGRKEKKRGMAKESLPYSRKKCRTLEQFRGGRIYASI